MSLYTRKQKNPISRLRLSDQKEIQTIEALIQRLLSEDTLEEYVCARKEQCDLGAVQAKILEESERTFISFLKNQASELILSLIEEKILSYETNSNEPFRAKAISAINRGNKKAFHAPVPTNK